MGNCFSSKNIDEYEDTSNNLNINKLNIDYKEKEPLLSDNNCKNKELDFDIENLPNIGNLNNIYNNKICALCEKHCTTLKKITDVNNKKISNIVFCLKCRKKLGY
jgi:hypothetical protein